jgi:hypothetical protein
LHGRLIRCSNNLNICLKAEDSIYIEEESSSFAMISEYVMLYIVNPTEDPQYSEKKKKKIEYIGEAMISKGWVYFVLNCFPQKKLSVKTWKQYFSSVELIKQAFYELRNEYSTIMWDISYNKLDYERKVALSELYPVNVCALHG